MIGQTISHYEILEKLGEGGMGVVYKARDTLLDRFVALKFLPAQFTQDKDRRERFITEAKAASALDHPNICTIYEIDETDDGQLYICMAFYGGQTLKDKIKDKRLKIKDAVSYAIQLAQGLQRAHEERIIHRDIKPANIMITDRGEIKILDFGLAKLAGENLTETISTKGTIAYMAPEVIRGLPLDHRSDIWSLGVVLYEMLTGHLPFSGEYAEPMMYSILNESLETIGKYREDVPGSLEITIEKLLKKDRDERYQDLGDLLMDLDDFSKSPSIRTERSEKSPLKLMKNVIRWRYRIAGLLVIILMMGMLDYDSFIPPNDTAYYPFTAEEWRRIEEARNREFVIAVLPFWGVNDEAMQEGRVMQALISRQLYDEFGQEPRIKIISPPIEKLPRSHKMVQDLNKRLTADLYIWGEVYILHDEVEIQPYLTTFEDLSSLWNLNIPYDIPALEASLTDVSKLTFRRAKAEEISNIILCITGHSYIQNRNFEKALLILKQIKPPTTQSLALLGDIYFLKGERAAADSLYQLAVTLDPDDPFHYLRLANVYYENVLLQKALQSVRMSLSIDSDMVVTYIILGNIYNSMGKREKMWDALEKGLQLDSSNIALYLSFSTGHFEDSNYEQAIHYINKAIQIDPSKSMSYLRLGMIYNRLDQYDETIEMLLKLVKTSPLEASTYKILGDAYKGQGKYNSAEEQYLKAIQLNESNEFNYQALAFLYMFQQNYQAAIPLWEKTIELTPNSPYWRIWLARTYILAGDLMKAESILQKFIEQVPSSESAVLHLIFSNLGIIHYLNGQFEKALEYLLKRLDLGTAYGFGHVTAHCFFLLHQLGKTTEAVDIVKKALTQLNPNNKKESWQRHLLLFLLGEISESELFQLANHQSPQHSLMHLNEAYYYAGKKYLLKSTQSDTLRSEYHEKAGDMFRKCVEMKNNPFVFQSTEILLATKELVLLEGTSR